MPAPDATLSASAPATLAESVTPSTPWYIDAMHIDLTPQWWEVILALSASAACGMLLGWERELRQKPAGIKTHGMVALGAAVFTLLGVQLALAGRGVESVQSDLLRVVSAVAGGVGFLGAGAIFRDRGGVEGLTTAATLWIAAAIGAACGVGQYLTVAVALGIALIMLTLVRAIEHRAIRD